MNPELYAQNARFVSDLGEPLLDLLAVPPGARVLDLGCGDGALTLKLQERRYDVLGVDASAAQVEAARQVGVNAKVMRGEELEFDQKFDAVFTNAALHWMRDIDAVLAGVRRALRPGGQFVGEFGGEGNVGAIRGALHQAIGRRGLDAAAIDPWYFPSPDEFFRKLSAEEFAVDQLTLTPRPTRLPGEMIDWLKTFAQPFTNELPPDDRDAFLAEVQESLRPQLCGDDGVWVADYVRLRFAARLNS